MNTTADTVSFKVSTKFRAQAAAIVAKAVAAKIVKKRNTLDHIMDLCACHANGCPLDLVKLNGFDDFSLSHDLHGINRHLSKQTGKIDGHFLPRCAA